MDFDLEHRGKQFFHQGGGYTNQNYQLEECYDGLGFFHTLISTWEPDPENNPLGLSTYVITLTSIWDANNLLYVITRNPETDLPPYDDEAYLNDHGTWSYQLVDEYTNDELMQEAYDQVQENNGEWITGTASQNRLLFNAYSCDYTPSCIESSLQVRVSHPPTATGYLKVWLVKRVRQYNPETDTYSLPVDGPFEEYEWSGSPNDFNFGINEAENRINGPTYTLERPSPQTSVTIQVFKFSLLPNYEPDDPIIDENYFELPNVDNYGLSNLIRPTPDCKSNGVPTISNDCPAG